MPGSHHRSSRSRTLRRWRIPTALAHGDDVLEGLSVLDDVPGELGIVLWQALRDASLWAAASPKARSGIFTANAEANRMAAVLSAPVPRELEVPLGVLARMTGAPETAGEANVALALREISLWLDERGLLGSALAYAHAAAMVSAGDAATAFIVGRLARRRAEYVRAETWFRRTAALARQSADWASYARAFMGLGALYLQRGNLPLAYRFRRRALETTERRVLEDLRGTAYHDLFEIAVHMDRGGEAHAYARCAFEAYGSGHARVPMLAHDVAYFWMQRGGFERALAVFEAILPHFARSTDRVMVLSGLARAAGGSGRRDLFDLAWAEVARSMRQVTEERQASVLLEVAQGAISLSDWGVAQQAAEHALDVATRRAEGQVRLAAEAVLDCARRHESAERASAATLPLELERAADSLASEFVESLRMAGSAA
jgi:tetratricopeptide (TPR) repeat protein